VRHYIDSLDIVLLNVFVYLNRDIEMRLTIVVGENTDQALRADLSRRGGRKGSLSKFVEPAVRDKIFFETVERVKNSTAQPFDNETQQLIGDAIAWAREDRHGH
jgi:hypothetical protein